MLCILSSTQLKILSFVVLLLFFYFFYLMFHFHSNIPKKQFQLYKLPLWLLNGKYLESFVPPNKSRYKHKKGLNRKIYCQDLLGDKCHSSTNQIELDTFEFHENGDRQRVFVKPAHTIQRKNHQKDVTPGPIPTQPNY